MKKLLRIIGICITVSVVIFCLWRGVSMPYDSLVKVYEVLLTASGILFGIFGVWVSVLYPGILEKSLEPNNPDTTIKQASCILKPLFISLFLFLVMLIVIFFAPFLKSLNLPSIYNGITKSLSAGIAAVIFLKLLKEIIVSMGQTEGFLTSISRNAIIADMRNRFMSGTRISANEKTTPKSK